MGWKKVDVFLRRSQMMSLHLCEMLPEKLKAPSFAMRWAADHGVQHLHLYYDYQGIENWCTGAWRTTKRGTMDYC